MKRKQKKSGETTGVSLTPVLSIAFLMLLFFVVAAPFMRERGFGSSADHGCDVPVFIMVDSHNRIFIEDSGKLKQVDIQAVKSNVWRQLAETPDCSSVVVMAHRQSDMGIVIRVMDQAKQARDIPPHVTIAMMDL